MMVVVGVGPLRIQTQTLVLVSFQLLRDCTFSYRLLVVASSSLLLCFLQLLLLLFFSVVVVVVGVVVFCSFCSCHSSET